LSEAIQPGASIDTASSSGNHTISSVTSKPESRQRSSGCCLRNGPLEAIVIGGMGAGECGHRIQPKSVECFDPKIKVAIGLRPDPLARMTEM